MRVEITAMYPGAPGPKPVSMAAAFSSCSASSRGCWCWLVETWRALLVHHAAISTMCSTPRAAARASMNDDWLPACPGDPHESFGHWMHLSAEATARRKWVMAHSFGALIQATSWHESLMTTKVPKRRAQRQDFGSEICCCEQFVYACLSISQHCSEALRESACTRQSRDLKHK